MTSKFILSVSAFLLALGIALGAFGAHALEDVLSPKRLETWETAVNYQMWNALGLMGIGIIAQIGSLHVKFESLGVLLGLIIFSGSLYILCLTDIGLFGAITPIGGTMMIAGWTFFGIKLVKAPTIIQ